MNKHEQRQNKLDQFYLENVKSKIKNDLELINQKFKKYDIKPVNIKNWNDEEILKLNNEELKQKIDNQLTSIKQQLYIKAIWKNEDK